VAPAEPHEILVAALTQAEMSFGELWLAYVGLGGVASPSEVHEVLDGRVRPSRIDFDMLGQALNERFAERGFSRPVPDAREVGL
jgi:hypothetical protein